MAFITNTKTGITIECSNKDVIATLKKDPAYIVKERVDLSEMKLDELKAEAVKRGLGVPKKVTKAQLLALLS